MHGLDNPGLTVSLAMAAGVLAQGLARHLRLPGIVVLLFAGVLLGPDFADIVRPHSLGGGLHVLVGFAVAVILFEGGMQLNLGHLRRQAVPIRRLVTIGAVITALGATAAAWLILGWDWKLSALFGTLVIVTGPTVINPLLQRIRLHTNLATILEAEGIFIDAVGATIAVVALEVVLAPSAESLGHGFLGIAGRIGAGALIGALGGGFLALLLYWKPVVPKGLHNVLSLALALAIYQVSNVVLEESGITAAIVAGLVVGNVRSHAYDEILEFKEQLTTFFIATLFVLLSADVRVSDVVDLGWPGLIAVVALMVVVRPITVFASTAGTDLNTREKAFLSWLAPRGIVAAAVSSLFAGELAAEGVEGGRQLQAMVFLVIALTVTLQGLSGGPVATLLKVRRPAKHGYVVLGASAIGLQVAEFLRSGSEEVVLIDANPDRSRAAEEAGFKVVYGNGLQERTMQRAHLGQRAAIIAATTNEEVNYLFATKASELSPGVRCYVALETGDSGVTDKMVEARGAHLLFGRARRMARWRGALERGKAQVEHWRLAEKAPTEALTASGADTILVFGGRRKKKTFLVDETTKWRQGDLAELVIAPTRAEAAREWLTKTGWRREEAPPEVHVPQTAAPDHVAHQPEPEPEPPRDEPLAEAQVNGDGGEA